MRISFRHKIAAEVKQAPAAMQKNELEVKPEDQFADGLIGDMAKEERRAKRLEQLKAIGSEYSPKAEKEISKHIKHHENDLGMKPDQAIAVSLEEAREKGLKVPDKK